MHVPPIRSLLFAPANQPDLIRKFPRFPADAFAIDLEDGTPETEKNFARKHLASNVDGLRAQNFKGRLYVRINARGTDQFEGDLTAALATPIDGVILPMLETVSDLETLSVAVTRAEERRGSAVGVIGLIETALGVTMVETLAQQEGFHLEALAFGAEDFVTDIGARRTDEGLEVLYARSRVIVAARASGIGAIDQVFVHIRDDEGFRDDAELGRQLGYDGKLCLTPQQVDIANEVFAPSDDEVEHSRRLIQAYDAAQAEGRGAVAFEGQMVDAPVLERARAILELARQVRERPGED